MHDSDPSERIFETNPDLVDNAFRTYRQSATAVSSAWRHWFDGFRSGFVASAALQRASSCTEFRIDAAAQRLSDAYKRYGHLRANTNPLGLNRDEVPVLSSAAHGLGDCDLESLVSDDPTLQLPQQSLRERISNLQNLFCGTAAPEFEHVESPEEKAWLYQQANRFQQPLSSNDSQAILRELAFADAFEKTLATKYIGKKRFSIEGADAQIPALETLLDRAAQLGVKECLMGMAHRGRLATIVGVVKMPFEMMLAEFEGEIPDDACCDDVKYHCGYQSSRETRSGLPINILMTSNPSHLEAVDPVLLGETRARQTGTPSLNVSTVLPVLLHGDAAISGQGVVYETLQMSNLPGYTVGGTIHIVTNNQLGFTTDPEYSRSSTSCTDIARVIGAPIVHVNSEDLVALHNVMMLAVEYRQTFGKDFFVDLVCYRRHGHNEADEPTYTQPALYRRIKEKNPPWMLWRDSLLQHDASSNSAQTLNDVYAAIRKDLDEIYLRMKKEGSHLSHESWTASCGHPSKAGSILTPVKTAVSTELLSQTCDTLLHFPPHAKLHAKLARKLVADRAEMKEGKIPVDWGFAENLAYGTLVAEGFSFRLSGQDVGRGTFSHRHAVFVDEETGEHYLPLSKLLRHDPSNRQTVEVINSPLSEFSVLGFEYGFARTQPNALTVWEAQFGDFVNEAQVILDQFLSAGECKWHRSNSLVLLLPHGFEGQGAEHSSGRMERFLQLAADGNMIVANVTSAGQLFHILRRQVHSPARKPLVLFTPKSYLRSPLTASPLHHFTNGMFEELVDDSVEPDRITRLLFCSGKITLDLLTHRTDHPESLGVTETAIIRIEQLYPLHSTKLASLISRYRNAKHFFWVQEEPRNMGAAFRLIPEITEILAASGKQAHVEYIGRHAKSSPAGGLERIHKVEQAALIKAAFEATSRCEV